MTDPDRPGASPPYGARPPGAVDTLRIEGITLPARIGVYTREKKRLQTLRFDVDFEVDAQRSAPDDALRDTVDYAAALALIEELLGRKHYNLIETVAESVAAMLLERFASSRVRVKVTKPGVPQQQSCASIEVVRMRTTAPQR